MILVQAAAGTDDVLGKPEYPALICYQAQCLVVAA
jgi:hypothetical protein